GICEKSVRHRNAERLGGLEIDHEFELGRLLHRQIGGFLTLENTAGIAASETIYVSYASPIAHQSAGFDKLAAVEYRWNGMATSQMNKPIALAEEEGIRGDEKSLGSLFRELRKGRVDFAFAFR